MIFDADNDVHVQDKYKIRDIVASSLTKLNYVFSKSDE